MALRTIVALRPLSTLTGVSKNPLLRRTAPQVTLVESDVAFMLLSFEVVIVVIVIVLSVLYNYLSFDKSIQLIQPPIVHQRVRFIANFEANLAIFDLKHLATTLKFRIKTNNFMTGL